MKSLVKYPSLSIEFTRDEIPASTMSPSNVPDEKWHFVDKKGHGHFWNGNDLPTLEWVVTGTEWVGDEYDGMEYEVGEYRCRVCGEVIKPQKRTSYEPQVVFGPTLVTVTINEERFLLGVEDYSKLLAKWAELLREESASR